MCRPVTTLPLSGSTDHGERRMVPGRRWIWTERVERRYGVGGGLSCIGDPFPTVTVSPEVLLGVPVPVKVGGTLHYPTLGPEVRRGRRVPVFSRRSMILRVLITTKESEGGRM